MKSIFRQTCIISALCIAFVPVFSQGNWHIAHTFSIASPGGWDYLAVNSGKLYVSHGTQVNVLDEKTGDSLGVIPGTIGVHGIAFNDKVQQGYTSNGRSNSIFIFSLKDFKIADSVKTGENPDAILFEPFTGEVITCNGRSKDLSIIDPVKKAVIATIPVGGKPETAASNGKGKLFVNSEDKHEIVVVNLKDNTVEAHWSLSPDESPTGLAYDPVTNRLFAGCEKHLVVMDAGNGSIISVFPIGDGCDGVAFNPKTNLIFTSNGEGTMTVIQQLSATEYKLLGTVPTKRGARTITVDAASNTVFMPTADFETQAPGATGRPKMIPGTFQVLVIQE